MDTGHPASAETRLRAQTERLSRVVSTQREIAAADLDFDSVMDLICERIRELTKVDSATILLLEGDHFVHKAVTGTMECIRVGDKVPLESSFTGWVHRGGKAAFANDSHTDPRFSSGLAASRGIRSALAVPLHHGDDVVGQLHALCTRPHAFSELDVDTLELLSVVVSLALSRAGELEAKRALLRQAQINEHQALHDALTGLANRRKFFADSKSHLAAASDRETLALAVFDLDGFKSYNDMFGHPAGDSLLRRLSKRLTAAVDGQGTAYRMGGDEFCVVSAGSATAYASTFKAASSALSDQGEGFAISCSYGSAALPSEAKTIGEALQLADRRLYAHKRSSSALHEGLQARDALVQVLAEKSQDLALHVNGVGELAAATATELGLATDEVAAIRVAAQLHDIGKVAIPESILNKPDTLDEAEWRFMKWHTLIGERILAAAPALADVASVAPPSHEQLDGGGYPDGLARDQIPLGARIVAVGDAFEAMTSDRPYRDALTVDESIVELRRCSGTQFDPVVVDAFLTVLEGRRETWDSAAKPEPEPEPAPDGAGTPT